MKPEVKKKRSARETPESHKDEMGVLSSILQSPSVVLAQCIEKGITPPHFYHANLRLIYEVIMILWSETTGSAAATKINFITLTGRLRDRGDLAAAGGASFVTELFTYLPTAANCPLYLEAIVEKYSRRQAIAAYESGATLCYTEHEKPIGEIIADTGAKLISVITHQTVESSTAEAFAKVRQQITQREGGAHRGPIGLPTGVPGWINSLCGIFEGTMYVIAGRPGMAKTALTEQMVDTQLEAGIPVLYVEKDMPIQTLIGRMAARRANISYDRFLTGESSEDDLDYMRGALSDLERIAVNLHLYDTVGMTAEQLDLLVRAEKQRHGIRVFYLDHFLNLKVDRSHGGQLVEGLTMASGTLRRCITETGVPGIILVHINREGSDGEPRVENIKYCDGLLADSDVTCLLWSLTDPATLGPNVVLPITMTVGKNRNGPKSREEMSFHQERTRFVEL